VASSFQTGRLGYRYRADADLTNGRNDPIDLRGNYLPFDSQIDVIGPADTFVSVTQQLAHIAFSSTNSGTIESTHLVLPTQIPVVQNTTVQSSARTFPNTFPKEDGPSISTSRSEIAWGPASKSTTLDLTTPLRDFTMPEFDATISSLRWTETAGSPGDMIWARVSDGGGEWVVIAPRTDEAILRLPVLPQVDPLRPQAFLVNNFAIVATEGGYDRLRPYLLGHWTPTDGNFPMKEASGRVSFRSLH
jgi:hypothetical protein